MATLIAFSGITVAQAHTKLISANPAAASEVSEWPTQITLEFDEELQNLGDEKANFVVVNNAVGDQVSESDEQISGNTITVTLSANEVKGPVLVFYHVVSGDGHPVEGEYKFTYGVGEVTAQGVEEQRAQACQSVSILLLRYLLSQDCSSQFLPIADGINN
jgi:methionine-rich copper-binding protein CopC